MSDRMKAAIVHDFSQPVIREEVSTPIPRLGEALVRVVATCVCPTQLHVQSEDWPPVSARSIIADYENTSADIPVNALVTDTVKHVIEAVDDGPHGVLVTTVPVSVSVSVFAEALQIVLRKEATTYNGQFSGESPTPLFEVVLVHTTTRDSMVLTHEHLVETVELPEDDEVAVLIHGSEFDNINSVFVDLETSKAGGRVIINI